MTVRSILLAALLLSPLAGAQTTRLVPETHATIQEAIFASSHGDTVSVAPGDYVGNLTFAGRRILVKSRRGPQETFISGLTDDATVVRFAVGETRESILDGFTIRYGGWLSLGGGVYTSNSSPTVRNCIIRQNDALDGGGVYCTGGAPLFQNCLITRNWVTFDASGMWFGGTTDGWALVVNCVVYDNRGVDVDLLGAIGTFGTQLLVVNTISRNNFWSTSDMWLSAPAMAIHSNWLSGFPSPVGNGNLSADPQFLDPAGADFHLRAASPCRDAGTRLLPNLPGLVGGIPATDIDGDVRWLGATPEMGYDEYTPHLAHVGALTPGATIQLRLFGVPPGEPCQGWASTDRLVPPLPTPFGPLHLASRAIQLFPPQPMPASELLQAPFGLSFTAPGLDELYAQALGGGAYTNLEVIDVP